MKKKRIKEYYSAQRYCTISPEREVLWRNADASSGWMTMGPVDSGMPMPCFGGTAGMLIGLKMLLGQRNAYAPILTTS